jgi:REP element-mobilizing transposase RayT
MPRVPRSVLPDGLFHVATRGVAKMAIYLDDNDRRNFLGLLALAVQAFEWECLAFCLMTTHYHLVLETSRQNLSDGMQILNGDYAQGFNGKYERWGHVFGDRYWSRALADEEELERICEYVMENPVRAGLCRDSSDWPWSACRVELG